VVATADKKLYAYDAGYPNHIMSVLATAAMQVVFTRMLPRNLCACLKHNTKHGHM
jgi:hypothetical protein